MCVLWVLLCVLYLVMEKLGSVWMLAELGVCGRHGEVRGWDMRTADR